ncbi:hypothetical protein [Streptomyces brasiliscabiei]|uniref:hypothetical protein n=1 Tax=Streptomyces brasiliscabiei TaxID=2736302 RepID=UPI001C104F5D|nr:hypothetical protein [Streptomyces brasiliscabiei]
MCVALSGAGIAVTAAQTHTEGASASVSSEPKETENDALQACADSWNDGNQNKSNVASISTAAQAENPTAYVHVGFNSAFPDRCMITVANPSTMYAQQYVQENAGAWSITPAWTGVVNDLDESVLPWNARMATDGTIIIL